MFGTLAIIAVIAFIAHVSLLLASFPSTGFHRKRYFWSHATLWLAGLLLFLLAIVYNGSGRSAFVDYFDSPFKRSSILLVTVALSGIAHLVVGRWMLKGQRR